MGDHGAHDQPRAVLHQHMALVAQDDGGVVTFPEQPCVAVGSAGMGAVNSASSIPSDPRIAVAPLKA